MRMVQSAGIGTYLQELVPRLFKVLSQPAFCLLGRADLLRGFSWAQHPNIRIIDCRAGIYSLREQVELPMRIPRDTTLYWSPHYNIPLWYRGPLLVTVHDTFHLAMPQFVEGWHRRAYARLMFRAVRAKAAAIVCVSRFARDQLLQFVPEGRQDVTVVHNGVDVSWFAPVPGGPPHGKPYVLFVGSVKPHKNLSRLLEAFALLQTHIPHDLVIIGRREGLITGDASAMAMASAMSDRVICVGELDHGDERLRRFYRYADVLVMPSLYESFGLPALEALASGCPVIVSRVAGLPEVYGEGAMYCDPYDPSDIAERIRLMVSDRGVRERYLTAGQAVATQYDWDTTVEKLAAVVCASRL